MAGGLVAGTVTAGVELGSICEGDNGKGGKGVSTTSITMASGSATGRAMTTGVATT